MAAAPQGSDRDQSHSNLDQQQLMPRTRLEAEHDPAAQDLGVTGENELRQLRLGVGGEPCDCGASQLGGVIRAR